MFSSVTDEALGHLEKCSGGGRSGRRIRLGKRKGQSRGDTTH